MDSPRQSPSPPTKTGPDRPLTPREAADRRELARAKEIVARWKAD